jgi:hypothetical protein
VVRPPPARRSPSRRRPAAMPPPPPLTWRPAFLLSSSETPASVPLMVPTLWMACERVERRGDNGEYSMLEKESGSLQDRNLPSFTGKNGALYVLSAYRIPI